MLCKIFQSKILLFSKASKGKKKVFHSNLLKFNPNFAQIGQNLLKKIC